MRNPQRVSGSRPLPGRVDSAMILVMIRARNLTLILVLFAATSAPAAEPFSVRPSDTDRRITEFNSPHLVWMPEGKPRNQLLLFLPGTGGTPETGPARFFTAVAARLGYHVILLMYPDNVAAQQMCSRSNDPDAYLKFRNGIIRGGGIGRGRTIAPQDSIERRVEQLLVYLRKHQPDSGWDQYLDRDGGIVWRLVVAAGQSQGGGHSYMLGKNHQLAHVLMFGSPKDYSFRFDGPAKGFDGETKTPLKRFFAYNHMRDNGNGCNHEQQMKILRKIGLTDLGMASADKPSASFGHAHVLFTDVNLPDATKFHGAGLNPRLAVNAPVWKYLLTEPVE